MPKCFRCTTKLLNAFEGGYVTTNNAKLAERLEDLKRFELAGEDRATVSR